MSNHLNTNNIQSIYTIRNPDLKDAARISMAPIVRSALFLIRFYFHLFYYLRIPGTLFISRQKIPAGFLKTVLHILYPCVAGLIVVLEKAYRIRSQMKTPGPVVIRRLFDDPAGDMRPVRPHAAYYRPCLPYPGRVSEFNDEGLVIRLRAEDEIGV